MSLSMSAKPACFKAYDIRGRVPDELDEELARCIGLAFAEQLRPRRVVVGYDIRLSSPALAVAVGQGLQAAGVEVLELGQCGTEEVYFATASHNPADYNGMKLVREGAQPVSGDSGLDRIGEAALQFYQKTRRPVVADEAAASGSSRLVDPRPAYLEHLLSYIDPAGLKPLTIVANPGNGGAGAIIDQLAARLPFTFIRLQWEADGRFPHGVPNPLLPENRAATAEAVRRHRADLGLAWDGDFDRCFFFDEQGNFIEGYYLVGLLAEAILARQPGAKIIHDPRLVWNTREIVSRAGGIPVLCKTGHAFIKERMRAEDAVYGGEMSAHHYFREFFYCDSGMIPWLLLTALLSRGDAPLSQLVSARQAAFPVSGEINRRVAEPAAAIARVKKWCRQFPGDFDDTDGLSFEAADFRCNLRSSNTEPVLRLNVETRRDPVLLAKITDQLLQLIENG